MTRDVAAQRRLDDGGQRLAPVLGDGLGLAYLCDDYLCLLAAYDRAVGSAEVQL